jgi:hypothetical protein
MQPEKRHAFADMGENGAGGRASTVRSGFFCPESRLAQQAQCQRERSSNSKHEGVFVRTMCENLFCLKTPEAVVIVQAAAFFDRTGRQS